MTAAMFQAMRDALEEQKQNPLSIDDVTAMIAGKIGQLAPMDKETVDLFQQFAKKNVGAIGKVKNIKSRIYAQVKQQIAQEGK